MTTTGRLLVATPPLGDPNFDRSVVYVLDHDEQGAVGVVVNRPTDDPLLDGLDAWEPYLSPPAVVFEGGPVETDSYIALGTAEGPTAEVWGRLSGDLATVDLTADPISAADRIVTLRVFRGYAGWSPGQLDAELDLGAWMVFDAEPTDVFGTRPATLWRDVLRRQGGRLAWIANAPDDLEAN
jgi:putative transcriptional regulator